MYNLSGKKVWVAGHNGMVGQALTRRLQSEKCELVSVGRKSLDLRRQADVEAWMEREKPQAVFVAAATVGGIYANDTQPAEFLYDNLMIEANIIHAAYRIGVEKLLFLGTACIYPKFAQQPIREASLLTGSLEPTNQWYAIAKIAGIKLCASYRRQYGCDFISAMPTNLYGINDNFTPMRSHVIPALMRRMHEAKLAKTPKVEIWGTGTPRREFLFSEDAADGLVHLMKHYSAEEHVNMGCGDDLPIRDLAEAIAKTVGYEGELAFDATKPDGTPRKLLDASVMQSLGWKPKVPLDEGMRQTYRWFLENVNP